MKSSGILARFSAQPVSMTPVWALSTSSVKPRSVQKALMGSQSCSGLRDVTSQRCWPWRSIRKSPSAVGAIVPAAGWLLAGGVARVLALTVPEGVGWKRPSRLMRVRSGGTSSPAVWPAWVR